MSTTCEIYLNVGPIDGIWAGLPADDLLRSTATRFAGGSPGSSGSTPVLLGARASVDVVGDNRSVFFSLSCASNPSTRFNSASKTSVFGPRFLGTASVTKAGQSFDPFKLQISRVIKFHDGLSEQKEPTVYTRTLEHLTGFTRRAKSITLDLGQQLAFRNATS